MPSTLDLAEGNARILREAKTKQPKPPKKGRRPKAPRCYADLDDPDQVVKSLLSRLRQAIEVRRPHEETWRQIVMAWLMQAGVIEEDAWESNYFLPIIFKQQETAVATIMRALIDRVHPFRVVGATTDGKAIASAQEALLNHQAVGEAKWISAARRSLWFAGLLGTGGIDHLWDSRVETRMVAHVITDPETEKPVKRIFESEVQVADNPLCEPINPLDLWLCPGAQPGDNVDWYIKRVRTTVGELRALAGKGHIDADQLEAWLETVKPQDDPVEATSIMGYAIDSDDVWRGWLEDGHHQAGSREPRNDDELDEEKELVVLRYVSKRETITLGAPGYMLGYSSNPLISGKTGLVYYHWYEVPDAEWGRGMGHVLLGHQHISNEYVNIWLDTARLELYAPVVIDKNRISITEDDLIWQPNGILRARGGKEAVQRLDVAAPTDLFLKANAYFAADADDATGFAAQSRGIQPKASTSATAFQGVESNLTTRLTTIVDRIGEAFSASGQSILDLNLQFMDKAQVVRVVGEEGLEYREIQPHEIVGRSLVTASVSAARLSREQVGQRMLQMLQVATPLMQAGALNDPRIAAFLRTTMDLLDCEDVDKILPKQGQLARDPLTENAFFETGGHLEPLPAEDHFAHLQAHQQLEQEWMARVASGEQIPPDRFKQLAKHNAVHEVLAAQQMATMAGVPGGGGAPASAAGIRGASGPAATEGGAQDVAAKTGGQGTPGVAAPGPAAAPGRPM